MVIGCKFENVKELKVEYTKRTEQESRLGLSLRFMFCLSLYRGGLFFESIFFATCAKFFEIIKE